MSTGPDRREAATAPAPAARPSSAARRTLTYLGAVASSALAALVVAGLAAFLSTSAPPMPDRASVGRLPGITVDQDERPSTPADDPVGGPLLQPVRPAADVRQILPPEE